MVMNENNANIQISADPKSCKILKNFLQSYADIAQPSYTETQTSDITIHSATLNQTFQKPMRIGKILDEIERHIRAEKTAHARFIKLKDSTLDTHLGLFARNGQKDITLTEKEVEILVILSKQNGQAISRDDLLHAVWNYAEGVETHTLETHIYRLRQKIEKSPSEPEILITQNDGYIIEA